MPPNSKRRQVPCSSRFKEVMFSINSAPSTPISRSDSLPISYLKSYYLQECVTPVRCDSLSIDAVHASYSYMCGSGQPLFQKHAGCFAEVSSVSMYTYSNLIVFRSRLRRSTSAARSLQHKQSPKRKEQKWEGKGRKRIKSSFRDHRRRRI